MEPQIEDDNETQESPEYDLPTPAQNGHLLTLLCHVAAPIVWPWKRRTFETVDVHGKAALNHMISSVLLFLLVSGVLWLAGKLSLVGDGAKTLISLAAILGPVACSLWGLLRADAGVLIKYPLPFRWIK